MQGGGDEGVVVEPGRGSREVSRIPMPMQTGTAMHREHDLPAGTSTCPPLTDLELWVGQPSHEPQAEQGVEGEPAVTADSGNRRRRWTCSRPGALLWCPWRRVRGKGRATETAGPGPPTPTRRTHDAHQYRTTYAGRSIICSVQTTTLQWNASCARHMCVCICGHACRMEGHKRS